MSTQQLKLWYKKPANKWTQALMIGNGRLGAMIFGRTDTELIQLNDDTFWAGYPQDFTKKSAAENIENARKLISQGKYKEAESLISEKMLGKKVHPYLPLGNIEFIFDHNKVQSFRRELDINTAISKVEYLHEGITYTREYFSSFPDQAICMRFVSGQQKQLNFRIKISAEAKNTIETSLLEQHKALTLKEQAPAFVDSIGQKASNNIEYEDDKGMRAIAQIIVRECDGQVEFDGNEIKISNATTCDLIFLAATSYNGYDKDPFAEGKDEVELCKNYWNAIQSKSYEQLKEAHIIDYQSIFQRMKFNLEGEKETRFESIPTDQRLERLKHKVKGQIGREIVKFIKKIILRSKKNRLEIFSSYSDNFDDLDLIALYFQFGRYLLISSSRPGSQPANLQGIWNEKMRPPWGSNYTTNINLEMNYWPVESCNLSECFEPMQKLMEEVYNRGQNVAKVNYDRPGWVCHHNVNLWRNATPAQGSPRHSYWPMGAAWMSFHLWEHYLYSLDKEYLKSIAYPIMKDAAIFLSSWVFKDEEGHYITSPSTSPENTYYSFDGVQQTVSYATTSDLAIMRQHFQNTIAAAKILKDQPMVEKLYKIEANLLPYQIGKNGCLQEWVEDYEEFDPGHRHKSHLIGLHPGMHITPEKEPILAEACQKSLERRIFYKGGGTGWSCGWKINMFARLKQPKQTFNAIATIIKNSTYENLFDAHPPFQIDGNFGATAGIAEALMQSHQEKIEILPSLPPEWKEGSISGLIARGNIIVDIKWKNSQVISVKLVSKRDQTTRLRFVSHNIESGIEVSVNDQNIEFTKISSDEIELKLKANKIYMIKFKLG